MQIKNIFVQQSKDGTIWSTHANGKWQRINDAAIANQLKNLVHVFRKRSFSESYKDKFFESTMRVIRQYENAKENGVEISETNINKSKDVIQKLIAFFSEFQFEPNFRFVNTVYHYCANSGITSAKDYIQNYFSLTDNQYTSSIVEKMKSPEFNELMADFGSLVCTKQINKRFKVYYGSQGTGKTTKAMEEAGNLCMVCHSAMLPADLMEDFKFEDGKPNFKPSALQTAMVEGQKIVLDEINLLPFESLRFLQSILDGKTEFTYKGKTIVIKDGFQIIGTMNLTVNGCTFALPEPLVDRACELRKYQLTADVLVGALI